MSRLIVIALLLGNLLLVAFHATQADPEPDPPPLRQSPGLAELPTIKLLSELPQAITPTRACYSVGPFETVQSRLQAETEFAGVAIGLASRESEALVELGYWVTLPPFPSFAEAGTAVRELGRAGLEDVAVVSDSDGAMRVSLGYFLSEENARRRRDQVRELGYEVDTRLQREPQPRFWLDVELAIDSGGPLPGNARTIPCPPGEIGQAPQVAHADH